MNTNESVEYRYRQRKRMIRRENVLCASADIQKNSARWNPTLYPTIEK